MYMQFIDGFLIAYVQSVVKTSFLFFVLMNGLKDQHLHSRTTPFVKDLHDSSCDFKKVMHFQQVSFKYVESR